MFECVSEWIVLKCLFVPDIHFESLETRDKPQPLPMTGLGSVLSEVRMRLHRKWIAGGEWRVAASDRECAQGSAEREGGHAQVGEASENGEAQGGTGGEDCAV